MKKLLALITALTMAFSCASCQKDKGQTNEQKPQSTKGPITYYEGTSVPDFGGIYNVEANKETADDVTMYLYGLVNTTDDDITDYKEEVKNAGFAETGESKNEKETIYKNESGEELSIIYDDVNNLFIVGYRKQQ